MSQLAGFVLGNAYLALFFSQMETTDHIKKALVAYRQAETDKTEATNNPDLHHNSATVYECVARTHSLSPFLSKRFGVLFSAQGLRDECVLAGVSTHQVRRGLLINH